MIYLSEAAIKRVRKFLQKHPDGIGIYVDVNRSGCSGYGYSIDIAKSVGEHQRSFMTAGFDVVVDEEDLTLIDGMTLDVKKDGLNEYFTFDNPHATATCGCGTSFSVN